VKKSNCFYKIINDENISSDIFRCTKENTMRLSDNSIAQLVRVLQVALLTGTDITDNLRLMRFVENESVLDLDPDYQDSFDKNLQKLAEEAEQLSNDEA